MAAAKKTEAGVGTVYNYEMKGLMKKKKVFYASNIYKILIYYQIIFLKKA